MQSIRFALAVTAVLLLAASAAAEDQILKFRFATHDLQSSDFGAPGAEMDGHGVGSTQAFGVAFFEDGRIAEKNFVVASDNGPDAGSFIGYSRYTFDNGDSLSLRFEGGWSADGVGGDYEVMAGTGGYEGATGTGRFDAVDSGLPEATLYSGEFRLSLPDN
jgi:hypothetical protein